MRQVNKERIKSIAITGFLITSLIQVGILWGYQSQGTPTNFLMGIFGFSRQNQTMSDESVREKLFIPDRLIISNGQGSHWLVSRQDPLYKLITGEAGGYLKKIAEGELERSKSSEGWGDISSKQGFILEFRAAMKPDLLKWFTAASKVSADTPEVFKMMIKPDIVDKSLSEVYILGSGGELGGYSVSNVERSQTMQEMLNVFEKGENTYRNYYSVRDGNFDSSMPFEPDVLFVVKSPRTWPYYQLNASVPARLMNENELADIMLGSEKDRFNKNVYDGFLQFSNTENIYKAYDNGYLSYKYLADASPSEKGGIGDALMKAYTFVDRLNRLTNMKSDIYLSGVEDTWQGFYRFRFDYRSDDLPVFINIKNKGLISDTAQNAITIDASSKRVLQCDWIFREFTQGPRQNYKDRFLDVMKYYGESFSNLKIKAITTGYYIDSMAVGKMDPSLVIQERDKDTFQAFRMPADKGD